MIEEGNKEGYGFIHLFGGIWGAYEKPANVRNWIYHVPGSRYDTPGTIKALAKLQQWAKAGYFNDDYNAIGYDVAARLFAKGKGVFWIGGDWDSTIIKAGLGKERRRDADPARAERQWTSIGGLSGPWHISAKTKYADLGAEWLNYVITSTQAKKLMFAQQQLPADRSAKPPDGRPVPDAGLQRLQEGRRTTTGSCSTPTGPRRPCTRPCRTSSSTSSPAARRRRDGEGRPERLGQVRQDAPLS